MNPYKGDKWTPGPWIIETDGDGWVCVSCPINDYDEPLDLLAITDIVGRADDEEVMANARLIAAAPDMYEALNTALRIVNMATYYLPGGYIIDAQNAEESARAALAKAEGQAADGCAGCCPCALSPASSFTAPWGRAASNMARRQTFEIANDSLPSRKEQQELHNERYALALNMAVRSLEWLVNIGHDTGKSGDRPEPGEFEAAMTQAEHVLAAVTPLVNGGNFPVRFLGGEVPYYWCDFQELDRLIVASIPSGADFSFDYIVAFADMLSRATVEKQIVELRDIGSRFRIPVKGGNTGTVVGYDPGGSPAYAVHLDGTNTFYFAEEWEGEDDRINYIEFTEE